MKINSYENSVNFRANQILSVKSGAKKVMDVYKLNPDEDLHFVKKLFATCSAIPSNNKYLEDAKHFLSSFIANSGVKKMDPKSKIPDYYIGTSPSRTLNFAYKLDTNLDNFVLAEQYVTPQTPISSFIMMRSISDELKKNPTKNIAFSNSNLYLNNTYKAFIKDSELSDLMDKSLMNRNLTFQVMNKKVDLNKYL